MWCRAWCFQLPALILGQDLFLMPSSAPATPSAQRLSVTWRHKDQLPVHDGVDFPGFHDVNATIGDDLDAMKFWCAEEPHCVGFSHYNGSTGQGFFPKHIGRFDQRDDDWYSESDNLHWHFYFIEERAVRPDLRLMNSDSSKLGVVSEVFTYGAPATTKEALLNLDRADGCFPGLRVYTEDDNWANKQVDAAAIFAASYTHLLAPVVALHWDKDSYYHTCEDDPRPYWPQGGAAVYSNWDLHYEKHYDPRLKQVTVNGTNVSQTEPFGKAWKFAKLAYCIYDTSDNIRQRIPGFLPGWRLVGFEELDHDDVAKVLIVQEEESLDCALVFEGSHDAEDLLESMKSYATGYCGWEKQVHAGFRDTLWVQTHDLFPKLAPKLSKCSAVTCVGHSLGGSLCDLFAGCANSKRVDDPDYQLLQWVQETPELLPPF